MPVRGELEVAGRQIRLRPRTAAVLAYLLSHRDRVVGREELMREVWPDVVVTDDSLAQCIKEIRKALGARADCIRTLPRVGYAFADAPPQPALPVPDLPSLTVPRRWLAWAAALLIAVAVAVAAIAWKLQGVSGPQPLSVVVLPLQVEAADSTPAYLSEAITDQLTTDLSRISGSFVISQGTASQYRGRAVDFRAVRRELGVRYAVEGSVRRAAGEITLDLRLVDTEDGHVAWTDRVQGAQARVEEMQEEVVGRIARSLHLQLIDAEADRQRRRPSAHPDAYELTMQAWSLWQRQSSQNNLRARELLVRATELDPQSALAWASLANTYITEMFLDRTLPRAPRLALAEQAAERAYRADDHHVNALGSLGAVRVMQGQLEEAQVLFLEQLRINPNYAPGWIWRSALETELGQAEEAIASARMGIRLSPADPRLTYFYMVLAGALMHAGRYGDAVVAAEQATSIPRAQRYAALTLVSALLLQGDQVRARQVAAEFMARNPEFSIRQLKPDEPHWRPLYRERQEKILAALQAAGVPP